MGIRETTFYEGGPHVGDLIINILLGFTVICLPLTIGAIVRALWLRYKITDRRISVTGGWMGRDRTDIVYSEIVQIAKVPRGIGIWGGLPLNSWRSGMERASSSALSDSPGSSAAPSSAPEAPASSELPEP